MRKPVEKPKHVDNEFDTLQARFEALKIINEQSHWECATSMTVNNFQKFVSKNKLLLETLLTLKNEAEGKLPQPANIHNIVKMIIYLQVSLGSMSSDKLTADTFFSQALANLQKNRNKLVYDKDPGFYQLLFRLFGQILTNEIKGEYIELLWEYANRYPCIIDSAHWPILSARSNICHLAALTVTYLQSCEPEFIKKIFDATLHLHGKMKALATKTPADEMHRAFFLITNCESQILIYTYHHQKALDANDPQALKTYVLSIGKILHASLQHILRIMNNHWQIPDPGFLLRIFRYTINISFNNLEKMLEFIKIEGSRELFKQIMVNRELLVNLFNLFKKHCPSGLQKKNEITSCDNKLFCLQNKVTEVDTCLKNREENKKFLSLTEKLSDEDKHQALFEKIQKDFSIITACGPWDTNISEDSGKKKKIRAIMSPLINGLELMSNSTQGKLQPCHGELMKMTVYLQALPAKIYPGEITSNCGIQAVSLLKAHAGEIVSHSDPVFYEMLAALPMRHTIEFEQLWVPETLLDYAARETLSDNFAINLSLTKVYTNSILLILQIPGNSCIEKVKQILPGFMQFIAEAYRFPTRNILESMQLACILSQYRQFFMALKNLQEEEITKVLGNDPMLANPLQQIYALLNISNTIQNEIRNFPKAQELWKLSYQAILSCNVQDFIDDEKDEHFFEKAIQSKALLSDILDIGKNKFTDETKSENYRHAVAVLDTLSAKIEKQHITRQALIAEEEKRNQRQAKEEYKTRLKATMVLNESEQEEMTIADPLPDGKILQAYQKMAALLDLKLFLEGNFTAALQQYQDCLALATEIGDPGFQMKARSFMADILWKRVSASLMTLSSRISAAMEKQRILPTHELRELNQALDDIRQSADYQQLFAIYAFNLSIQGKKEYQAYANYLVLIQEIIIKINQTLLNIRNNMDNLSQLLPEDSLSSPQCRFFSESLEDRKAFPELKKKQKPVISETNRPQNPGKADKKTDTDTESAVLLPSLPVMEDRKCFSETQKIMADLIREPERRVKLLLPPELKAFFEKLKTLSGILVMTGSTVSNFYQKKNFFRSDIDFVLASDENSLLENSRQLLYLGFVKNEALKNDSWTLWSTRLQNSKGQWIPVDVVLMNKKIWLSSFLQQQDFTTALALDAEGIVYDLSGQAFKHLIEKKIKLVGVPCERLQRDPVLLLRIIDRLMAGNWIEETTEKAMHDWNPSEDHPSREARLNAALMKYLKKWNNQDFIMAMQNYGLPGNMFGITDCDNPEETLEKVKQKIARTAPNFLKKQEFSEEESAALSPCAG